MMMMKKNLYSSELPVLPPALQVSRGGNNSAIMADDSPEAQYAEVQIKNSATVKLARHIQHKVYG